MEQKIQQSFLIIEKVTRSSSNDQPTDSRECLARVPFATGEYQTENGQLGILFTSPDSQNRLKIIFSGDIVPTVKRRGKIQQFHRRSEKPHRRVVEFPLIPGGMIAQELSAKEYLLFRREEIPTERSEIYE